MPVASEAQARIREAVNQADEHELLANLANAVLLFHGGGTWDGIKGAHWWAITGEHEATTKVLCDYARAVLANIAISSRLSASGGIDIDRDDAADAKPEPPSPACAARDPEDAGSLRVDDEIVAQGGVCDSCGALSLRRVKVAVVNMDMDLCPWCAPALLRKLLALPDGWGMQDAAANVLKRRTAVSYIGNPAQESR